MTEIINNITDNDCYRMFFNKYSLTSDDKVLIIGEISENILEMIFLKAKCVVIYSSEYKNFNRAETKIKKFYRFKNKIKVVKDKIEDCSFPEDAAFCFINVASVSVYEAMMKLRKIKFKASYVLAQKDVAKRLMSQPGTSGYSRHTIITQLIYRTSRVIKVPKTLFPYKSDRCYVEISLKENMSAISIKEFTSMINICFNRANKTLLANLSSQMKMIHSIKNIKDKAEDSLLNKQILIKKIVDELKFNNKRPSIMYVEDFLKLLLFFKKEGLSF